MSPMLVELRPQAWLIRTAKPESYLLSLTSSRETSADDFYHIYHPDPAAKPGYTFDALENVYGMFKTPAEQYYDI
jgi:hypothetical protein